MSLLHITWLLENAWCWKDELWRLFSEGLSIESKNWFLDFEFWFRPSADVFPSRLGIELDCYGYGNGNGFWISLETCCLSTWRGVAVCFLSKLKISFRLSPWQSSDWIVSSCIDWLINVLIGAFPVANNLLLSWLAFGDTASSVSSLNSCRVIFSMMSFLSSSFPISS